MRATGKPHNMPTLVVLRGSKRISLYLYSDVVGYSRLTGQDEDATHRTLRGYLDLMASTIDSHWKP